MSKILFRSPKNYWTEATLVEFVTRHGITSLVDWRRRHSGSYSTATNAGVQMAVVAAMGWVKKRRDFWTYETLLANARASGASRSAEWARLEAGAYTTALNKKLIQKIREELGWPEDKKKPRSVSVWTKEMLIALVKKEGIKSVEEFCRKHVGAASSAYYHGFMDDISDAAGFDRNARTDADVTYLWGTDAVYNGKRVYKSGVTSSRLGDQRMREVAAAGGFVYEPIAVCKTKPRQAYRLEKKVLRLGDNPGYGGFNGASEFRALSDSELERAKEILKHPA